MSESVVPPEVIDHYEHLYDESARITTGFGTLELVRTQEIVGRALPNGRLRILDVGGGPGTYARWLAQIGHEVIVIDPVLRHVDVVLLLGPFYHLTERDDRVRAWQEAIRVVKPGGLVVGAAVNRFASLFSGLAEGMLVDDRFRAIVEQDLRDGQHRNPDRMPHWFTTAYFHRASDLAAEATEGGAVGAEVLGVEGLAAYLPQLETQWNDERGREAIIDAARAVESEPTLIGLSPHLLVIAKRPRTS